MKPIVINITTTETDQDILADFIKSGISAFVPVTRNLNTIDLDIELLFDSSYNGDIVVNDLEAGVITSKAQSKLYYSYQGTLESLVIQTNGTILEAKINF